MKNFLLLTVLCFAIPESLFSQAAKDLALAIWAECDTNTGFVSLTWEDDSNPGQFSLYRKDVSNSWAAAIATFNPGDTSFVDTTTVLGGSYEYRISKNRTGFTRNGYLEVSNYDTAKYTHGAVEILVQQGLENALGLEIERLEEDLLAEGWGPIFTSTVDTFWSSVQGVKSDIVNRAQSHSLEAVIIIGHLYLPFLIYTKSPSYG